MDLFGKERYNFDKKFTNQFACERASGFREGRDRSRSSRSSRSFLRVLSVFVVQVRVFVVPAVVTFLNQSILDNAIRQRLADSNSFA